MLKFSVKSQSSINISIILWYVLILKVHSTFEYKHQYERFLSCRHEWDRRRGIISKMKLREKNCLPRWNRNTYREVPAIYHCGSPLQCRKKRLDVYPDKMKYQWENFPSRSSIGRAVTRLAGGRGFVSHGGKRIISNDTIFQIDFFPSFKIPFENICFRSPKFPIQIIECRHDWNSRNWQFCKQEILK